jgi:hypothetical protein
MPASVSPGKVRRSMRIVQLSGTILACVPPQMAPTLIGRAAQQRMAAAA